MELKVVFSFMGCFILFIILMKYFDSERKFKKLFNLDKTIYSDLKNTSQVHVQGRSKMVQSFNSPLAGIKCCCYESAIYERSRSGSDDICLNSESDWNVVKDEKAYCNFLLLVNMEPVYIKTEHHKAFVKRKVDTHSEKVFDNSEFDKYWDRTKEFILKHNLKLRVCNVYDKPSTRITEGFIAENETVSVVGSGSWVATVDLPELDGLVDSDKVFVITGSKNKPIVFTNQNSLLWG